MEVTGVDWPFLLGLIMVGTAVMALVAVVIVALLKGRKRPK